jgi:hypothetical protein
MRNGQLLALSKDEDAALAKQKPPALANLPPEATARIAKLAYLITLEENARRDAGVLQPSWHELSDAQRDASCRGVLRVVQAMVLLGWIEAP